MGILEARVNAEPVLEAGQWNWGYVRHAPCSARETFIIVAAGTIGENGWPANGWFALQGSDLDTYNALRHQVDERAAVDAALQIVRGHWLDVILLAKWLYHWRGQTVEGSEIDWVVRWGRPPEEER